MSMEIDSGCRRQENVGRSSRPVFEAPPPPVHKKHLRVPPLRGTNLRYVTVGRRVIHNGMCLYTCICAHSLDGVKFWGKVLAPTFPFMSESTAVALVSCASAHSMCSDAHHWPMA